MSVTKNKRILITILLAVLSLALFGCKDNKTPVSDIYFASNEQIVMLVGEEDLSLQVNIVPSYATNKSYTLVSLNPEVVTVSNNKLKAVAKGEAIIRVISNDNNLLEDIITIKVVDEPQELSAPTSLHYNPITQTIQFDPIVGASGYSLKVVDGQVANIIDLGNVTSYALSDYEKQFGDPYDKLLSISVMSNAPTYTNAFIKSGYSTPISLYQHAIAEDISVVGGKLLFEKETGFEYDLYINNTLYQQNISSGVSLLDVSDTYAEQMVSLSVIKKTPGKTEDDGYHSSKSSVDNVYVFDGLNLQINGTSVSWSNVVNIKKFNLSIDDQHVAQVFNNSFDLLSLENFDNNYEQRADDYVLKVDAVIEETTANIISTSKISTIKFNRIQTPEISVSGANLLWEDDDLASAYMFELNYDEEMIKSSMSENLFSMASYPSGKLYTFSVQSIGQQVDDVYYISSKKQSIIFDKAETVQTDIDNYHLKFDSVIGDNYEIYYDDVLCKTISADTVSQSIALNSYDWEAGPHNVTVKHLGNYTQMPGKTISVDSNISEAKTFVQLEEIASFVITNGKAKAEISEYNKDAKIVLTTYNSLGQEIASVESAEYVYNTTIDLPETEYLKPDTYITKVQVLGNGRETFSYTGPDKEISFTVLPAPVLKLINNTKAEVTFDEITNNYGYNVYGVGKKVSLVDTTATFTLGSGESITIKAQTIGDGSEYLDSVESEIVVSRLTTPTLTFDNTNNSLNTTSVDTTKYDYIFTHKENPVLIGSEYNFGTTFNGLTEGDNAFVLALEAKEENTLNSFATNLTVHKALSTMSSVWTNTNNQLVITPDDNAKDYDLNLIFGFDSELNFSGSNGELSNGTYTLNYIISSGSYIVTLLNQDYTPIIPDMAGAEGSTSSFYVKAQLVAKQGQAKATSAYSDQETIKILAKTNAQRLSGYEDYISFANTETNNTYSDYALLVNQTELISLDNTAVVDVDNHLIRVKMDYILEETAFENINSVAIITLNNKTAEGNAILSVVGDALDVVVESAVTLTYSKDNSASNNSTIISFDAVKTSYDKTYVVTLTNEHGNTKILEFNDNDIVDDKISFNLDDVVFDAQTISISAKVETKASVGSIYHYTSRVSNTVVITKVDSVSEVSVINNTLIFASVDNVEGYEIYDANTNDKLNTTLLKPDGKNQVSYNVSKIDASKTIVIKAIANEGSYTNSDLSQKFTIVKLSTPSISTNNEGNIVVTLDAKAMELYTSENCSLIAKNGDSTTSIVKNDNTIVVVGNTIVIQPEELLNYGEDTISPENLEFVLIFTKECKEESTFYIDSNTTTFVAYGLLIVTHLQKTTTTINTNEYLEYITWRANANNTLSVQSEDVNAEQSYVIKITQNGQPYYSTDSKLKYKQNDNYYSYGNITTTSVIFPYGYDDDENGVVEDDEIFKEGLYEISVKTLPKTLSGYNVCSSDFSASCDFEIMASSTLDMQDGYVTWTENSSAEKYRVVYTPQDPSLTGNFAYVTNNKFDFDGLGVAAGIYNITVQSINTSNDAVLNSAVSEPITVYYMPKVASVYVDDGRLVISANQYFSKAELEFVDISSDTSAKIYKTYDRSDDAKALVDKKQKNWQGYTELSELDDNKIFFVEIDDSEIIDLVAGKSYNINVKLIGNSDKEHAVVNSVYDNANGLVLTKLYANDIIRVEQNGVIKISPYVDYIEDENFDSLQYNINNQQTVDNMWNNMLMYKIDISTTLQLDDEIKNSSYSIYALDYYKFMALNLEHEKLVGMSTLYSYYDYESEDGNKVRFNVFKDNQIDLSLPYIYYYPIIEEKTTETYKLSGTQTDTFINLLDGGNFVVNVTLLGGDTLDNRGYLSSNVAVSELFRKYEENVLTSNSGLLQLKNLVKYEQDENGQMVAVDYPVYKLTVLNTITNNGVQEDQERVVYLHYYDDEDIANAYNIVGEYSPEDLFVQIKEIKLINGKEYILFDMFNYFEANTYRIYVTTLAGLGSEMTSSKYLIDSKTSSSATRFKLIQESEVTVTTEGVLKFNRGYVEGDNQPIYVDNYEVTLIDKTGEEYVYNISVNYSNIVVDTSGDIDVIYYTLPTSIVVNGNVLALNTTDAYSIKIRPIAVQSENSYGYISGKYYQESLADKTTQFVISKGLSNVEVANGVLKWTVNDLENYKGVSIKITDLSNNNVILPSNQIGTRIANTNEFYYDFADLRFDIQGSANTTQILANVDYKIEISTLGNNQTTNILKSEVFVKEKANRISMANNIKSYNGILVWDSVEGAIGYKVTIKYNGNQTHVEDVNTNSLDVSNLIQLSSEENVEIKIRAIGTDKLSSLTTPLAVTFTVLDTVSEISAVGNQITWQPVVGANKYEIKLQLVDDDDNVTKTLVDETVAETSYDTSSLTGLVGKYKITLRAIYEGESFVFNGYPSWVISSKAAPLPVSQITTDPDLYAYQMVVNKSDFFDKDQLKITYKVQGDEESKEEYMSYSQGVDKGDGTMLFTFPLKQVGYYEIFYVQVVRENALNSTILSANPVNFNLFESGDGETEETAYIVTNLNQLLNIKYRNNKYFKLSAPAISIDEQTALANLQSFGAIIAPEFTGVIDGQNSAIIYNQGDDDMFDLQGNANMALFGTIRNNGTENSGIIKNLVIGDENNSTKFVNSFAQTDASVLKSSIIAGESLQATIKNINVINIQYSININVKLSSATYISSLVAVAQNTIIEGVNIDLTVVMGTNKSAINTYIGGVVSKAISTTIDKSDVNATSIVDFAIRRESSAAYLMQYVGGVAGWFEGNASSRALINNTSVTMTSSDIYAQNIGGIVGYAKHANITSSISAHTFANSYMDYTINLGGIVGAGDNITISSSNGQLDVDSLVIKSTLEGKYIGSVAGRLLENCLIDGNIKTTISTDGNFTITLGHYGSKSE